MKVEINLIQTTSEEKIVIHTKEINEEVQNIIKSINNSTDIAITGSCEGKIYLLNIDEINYFYSENQKIYAKTNKYSVVVKLKLYEIEEKLRNRGFIRISNSVIANINQIDNLEVSFNGVLCIKFLNKDVEYSSRRYVRKIKEYLGI